jgi:heat shock protein HslJ
MRTRAIAIVLAFAAVVAGCGGDDDQASTPATSNGSGSSTPSDLDGTTYLSTGVTGHKLVPGTRVSLAFDDGTISANAGCNTLSGNYQLDSDQLVVDQLGGTEMGCDKRRHDQDAWLTTFLSSQPTVSVAGNTVLLTGTDASLELRDKETVTPDKSLVGTTWVVDTIIDGETASSVPGDTKATITFPTDVRIEVYDGCNRTSGAVKITGASVTIVDLPAPVRANCAGRTPVDYPAVLDGKVEAEVDADRLTLTGPGGQGFGLHAE